MAIKEGHILIIEDNPSWQKTLKRNISTIEGFNWKIDIVDNYNDAIDKLDKCYYHLALVDLNLE